MAHFAELNKSNVVLQVVVVDDSHEADGENWCREFFGTDEWKQTSYNTSSGVHYGNNSRVPDGGVAFRKNYAGIGFTYNPVLDAFISPQPFDSWVMDESTCTWESPIPYPNDGNGYDWNESTQLWDQLRDAV